MATPVPTPDKMRLVDPINFIRKNGETILMISQWWEPSFISTNKAEYRYNRGWIRTQRAGQ